MGRKLIDNGIENLGASLSILEELIAVGKTDDEIARRMEAYAAAIATFTRCSSFTNISISAAGKFTLGWRPLLEIAREMYRKLVRWHAAGYDYVIFVRGNKSCWPAKDDSDVSSWTHKARLTGCWETLDSMVSVYCRGGVIEDPAAEQAAETE